MEKFAERYCKLNDTDGIFANADTAYVLAYSLIMLNTDAHSSQIKKKMTQQEFVNMNRGINDGGDLPQTFLELLYQAITVNEIKMKQEIGTSAKTDVSALSRPNRSKLFMHESAVMVKESQEAFKLKAKRKSTYFTSRTNEHVRPMFESTWCALLAACSAVMEDQLSEATPVVVAVSLRGFANAVHIAAEFGMNTERDAFVTMLAKYTYLESTRQMSWRNVDSFTTLVHVALTDGNGLGNSWGPVLKCLSEFQRLHMIGTGAKTDAQLFFPSGADGHTSPATPAKPLAQSKVVASSTRQSVIIQPTRPSVRSAVVGRDAADLAAVDEKNSVSMVDKVDIVAIDRIFSSSAQLGPEAIVYFVTNLCAVSREELASPADPQVYALQKLVEIAYYNMSRVRLVWARIWTVLGDFFTEVGQHSNPYIAMYAVDSLRQLSTKFLEKGELLNFAFQREFLKPFVDLMAVTTSLEIKELILGCLDNMVQSRATSIRSGWRPVLSVCALAANDESKSVATVGFALAQRVAREHTPLVVEHMLEVAGCLAAYLAGTHHELCLQATAALVDFSKVVTVTGAPATTSASSSADTEPSPDSEPLSTGPPDSEAVSTATASANGQPGQKIWWTLLGALSSGVQDERPAVRGPALQALFGVLSEQLAADGALHGELGRVAYCTFVLSMFEQRVSELAHANAPDSTPTVESGTGDELVGKAARPSNVPSDDDAAWLGTTGLTALGAAERCFCGACTLLGPKVLDALVALLVRCLQQQYTPALAHVAAEALLHLVKETGASFNQETWASVCAELRSCFDSSDASPPALPPQLADAAAAELASGEHLVHEVSQRVQREAPPGSGPHELQVLLLSTVYQLLQINHPLMKLLDIEGLLNCLHGLRWLHRGIEYVSAAIAVRSR